VVVLSVSLRAADLDRPSTLKSWRQIPLFRDRRARFSMWQSLCFLPTSSRNNVLGRYKQAMTGPNH
jgi:hypothetical protein